MRILLEKNCKKIASASDAPLPNTRWPTAAEVSIPRPPGYHFGILLQLC